MKTSRSNYQLGNEIEMSESLCRTSAFTTKIMQGAEICLKKARLLISADFLLTSPIWILTGSLKEASSAQTTKESIAC